MKKNLITPFSIIMYHCAIQTALKHLRQVRYTIQTSAKDTKLQQLVLKSSKQNHNTIDKK